MIQVQRIDSSNWFHFHSPKWAPIQTNFKQLSNKLAPMQKLKCWKCKLDQTSFKQLPKKTAQKHGEGFFWKIAQLQRNFRRKASPEKSILSVVWKKNQMQQRVRISSEVSMLLKFVTDHGFANLGKLVVIASMKSWSQQVWLAAHLRILHIPTDL